MNFRALCRNINVDLYKIINRIASEKEYIRLRVFEFFANTIYVEMNITKFNLYYFKYYINFKYPINLYIELELSN